MISHRASYILAAILSTEIVAIFMVALLLSLHAFGQPPPGADPNSEMGRWFQSLRVPGTGTSCCSLSDCRPTDYRQTPDGYEVMIDEKWGVDPPGWVKVPPEKILQKSDNPTGRGVLCYLGSIYAHGHDGSAESRAILLSPDRVLCFVRPAET